MTTMSFTTERRRLSAHTDHSLDCDSAPPNHRAHRIWFLIVVMAVMVAAGVALIGGLVKGLADIGGAFSSAGALLEPASWDRFFAGFGRLAALAVFAVLALMLLRRRTRKSAKK